MLKIRIRKKGGGKNMRFKIFFGSIMAILLLVLIYFGGYIVLLPSIILVGVYFIPALIATKRDHPQKSAILIINILLGWTFLGWVIALVWAILKQEPNIEKLSNKICFRCGNISNSKAEFCIKCGNNLINQNENKL